MCVTVGVLYLKRHSLVRRIKKIKDHMANTYQLCQGRKEAQVSFISQKSMAFNVHVKIMFYYGYCPDFDTSQTLKCQI